MINIQTKRIIGAFIGFLILGFSVFGLYKVINILTKPEKEKGFHFSILFSNVQGIRKGSLLLFKGMEIGNVTGLELFEEGKRIKVNVRLRKNLGFFVKTTTQCWIVRPRFSIFKKSLSGLETIIRDSYINVRSREGGVPIKEGDILLGLESPPDDIEEEALDIREGDLTGTVYLPENRGVRPGSPVLYRGITVGFVRKVRLGSSGNTVIVFFVVRKEFRNLVREKSRFWISRPIIKGGLLRGTTVEDLSSIVFPSLVFDRGEEPSGPAPDGAEFIGLKAPPEKDIVWPPKRKEKPIETKREQIPGVKEIHPFVNVIYSAVEKDTLSSDDIIEETGIGIIYKKDKEYYVITRRAFCDGSFLIEPHWYDRVRIANENIKILLSDGRIIPAKRIWIHNKKDLALLKLVVDKDKGRIKLKHWKEYLSWFESEKDKVSIKKRISDIIIKDGKAIGLLGSKKYKKNIKDIILFSLIPKEYRPK